MHFVHFIIEFEYNMSIFKKILTMKYVVGNIQLWNQFFLGTQSHVWGLKHGAKSDSISCF